jgi:hypothetical protein
MKFTMCCNLVVSFFSLFVFDLHNTNGIVRMEIGEIGEIGGENRFIDQ